jgi:hypothetical protein
MRFSLLIFLLVATVGCHPPTHQQLQAKLAQATVTETGKIVSVRMDGLPRDYRKRFLQFDGNYPPAWPSELSLPATFHYTEGNPLKEVPPPRGSAVEAGAIRSVRFSGIAKGTPSQVAGFFKQQFTDTGWNYKPLSGVQNVTAFQAQPPANSTAKFGVTIQPYVNGWV